MELFIKKYEIALRLKEAGFNEPCFAKFNKGKFQMNALGSPNNYNDGSFSKTMISAPMYQQVIDWLFYVHKLDIRYSPDKEYLINRIEQALNLIA